MTFIRQNMQMVVLVAESHFTHKLNCAFFLDYINYLFSDLVHKGARPIVNND